MHSLDRIQTFVRVVKANSFVGAAQQMNLSRAALSKQISVLEQELGIKLIQRTTRRLSLTKAGSLYYAQWKHLIDYVEEMDELAATKRKEPSGTLNLFCSHFFGEHVIVPNLREFLEDYPKVHINLRLEERIPHLSKEKIDIVIGTSIPGPPEAIQRTISKTRYIFCASPSYLKTFGNLLTCALNGLGIVKLHDYMVKGSLLSGQLIEILHAYSQEEYPIFLYYMQNRYLSPKIRHFIDFLLKKSF